MRRVIFSALLALAIGNTSQAAQIFKWVDAQGVTHFDAQPPAGQAAQQINTAQPPPPASAPTPPQGDVDGAAQQRAIDKQVKKQIATEEAKRKENCTKLRTNLAQLQNNPRVREQVEGETKRLSEDERQDRISETQKAIEDFCG
ncbi:MULTISPECIES: DUF4124 domain-containing protein [Pseudomonas]|jgi:hypothetical protein|uniref:Glycosyltransferase n=1 Tax=Pseudomonas syringae TaxID=317 RepID=A0A085UML4_PSESX|nr:MULTISPECIES: DUF4124 domain-containing protein [Pseudomonas]EPJ78230.1 hypothetical protein CFII64_23190 [Pseudomonas sp. CFII64]KFE44427.1 glycosyltransferase [Pseudomonas syringae]